jgi:hypothetical protein
VALRVRGHLGLAPGRERDRPLDDLGLGHSGPRLRRALLGRARLGLGRRQVDRLLRLRRRGRGPGVTAAPDDERKRAAGD